MSSFLKACHRLLLCLIAVAITSGVEVLAQQAARPDLVIADFEGDTYGPWKVEGEAFGSGPAKGTLPGQMHVSGFEGQGLVNSFFNGDGTTGTLTSPPVKIERHYLTFLIGGGGHPGQTCMNLVVDGAVVQSITGDNNPTSCSRKRWPWATVSLVAQRSTSSIPQAGARTHLSPF